MARKVGDRESSVDNEYPGRQGVCYGKEEQIMDRGIRLLDELQRMKSKMDQTWGELFEEDLGREQEGSRWNDKFPKFEGTKRTSKSRSKKAIKPF